MGENPGKTDGENAGICLNMIMVAPLKLQVQIAVNDILPQPLKYPPTPTQKPRPLYGKKRNYLRPIAYVFRSAIMLGVCGLAFC
jgi:hypothetical protein